jgi:uncharacterized protein YacL
VVALAHRVLRWVLAVAGLLAGLFAGLDWLGLAGQIFPPRLQGFEAPAVLLGSSLGSAIVAYLLGPVVVKRCYSGLRWVEGRLGRIPGVDLLAGAIGTIVGLIIAYLFAPALARIPLVGDYLPTLVSVALAYLGWTAFLKKREDWQRLRLLPRRPREDAPRDGAAEARQPRASQKVLDTSAVIDGRIAELCRCGFIEGSLVVPQFVLDELRHIADSADPLKRGRGRRGLDVLQSLQRDLQMPVEILDRDPGGGLEVDVKLVHVAQEIGAAVVTTDYNLNKVAALRGVKVLNVNELASGLRPVLLPGEEINLRLIREGNQAGQGVGYLNDGTMVVVEGGKRFIGADVDVEVTSVLQTAAGRMIFGRPKATARAVGHA